MYSQATACDILPVGAVHSFAMNRCCFGDVLGIMVSPLRRYLGTGRRPYAEELPNTLAKTARLLLLLPATAREPTSPLLLGIRLIPHDALS